MLRTALFNRLSCHVSSFTLVSLLFITYLLDKTHWINSYLPENGKPFVVFLLVAIVIIYELSVITHSSTQNQISEVDLQVKAILHQMEINRLVSSVNAMYTCFIQSKDEFIDNVYTIKELSELTDSRKRLGINSYTQGRIEYLQSKVRLNK
jgi:hypothetical protein